MYIDYINIKKLKLEKKISTDTQRTEKGEIYNLLPTQLHWPQENPAAAPEGSCSSFCH